MIYSLTDLKTGVVINLFGEPYQVLESQHSKLGRGGALMRTKLKNLKSGEIIEKTFKGEEQIQPASIDKKKAQFLYHEGPLSYFMNQESFEQFTLTKDQIGKKADFLKEGQVVEINYFENIPLGLEMPIKGQFKVQKTEPGLKGDRVSAGTKPAILETGAKVMVPLFIKEGDLIIVNTQTGEYVERAK